MTSSIIKGDYSIVGSSKSFTGGNIYETSLTGSGVGVSGVAIFQADILYVLEGMIRNHIYPEYSVPKLLRVGNNPLFLFYLPQGVVQPFTPTPTLLQQFLLMDNSLTTDVTIEITDLDKVKFIEYLSKKSFQILRNAAQEIDMSRGVETYCSNSTNSKFKKSVENSIFNLEVIVH